MADPRFERVSWDPKFKGIGRKSRKVSIDKRFQSMFTEPQFRVEYKFDKRGRKVKQSTDEDLRRYYKLDRDDEEKALVVKQEDEEQVEGEDDSSSDSGEDVADSVPVKKLAKAKERKTGFGSEDVSIAESAEWRNAGHADSSDAESAAVSDSEEDESEMSAESDEEEERGGALEAAWEAEMNGVVLSEETSHRLAVCNMDWDHVGAKDIFVLFSSFKPAGSSILSVSVYPSDFGLERMAKEDIAGPVGLVDEDEEEQSGEGTEYSKEKLREYQLNRFKYYYAVVECDGVETAECIYTECNGLEYERSGGRLDLRLKTAFVLFRFSNHYRAALKWAGFIPDDMSFEDRQAVSTAAEGHIPSDFTPADFVSLALQQSKVKLTWDETDPHRVKLTQKKFTKDDLQSMEFSAYLASSSGSEGDSQDEEPGSERAEEKDKKLRYKELLQPEGESPDAEREEMEITWEPGLKESVEKIVKKKRTNAAGLTPWEQYLQEKKERRKQAKRKKAGKPAAVEEKEGESSKTADSGFDDPFFQHSVTKATAATTRKKSKRKRELDEAELKEKAELELLMMSDGEDGGGRSHFSFPAIVRSEKEAKKKRKKAMAEDPVDNFKVDVSDPRFKDLFESHLYAPDPSHPQYKATRGMADIMVEKQRRRKDRTKRQQQDPSTGQVLDAGLSSLVKSVKSKAKLFKEKRRKLKRPEK